MNREAAKTTLFLYRPGTTDALDPEISEALEYVKQDPDLGRWLEEHCAMHEAIRTKFAQIAVPAGLKEQIISERRVRTAPKRWRRIAVIAAGVATVAALIFLLPTLFKTPAEDTFEHFRGNMVGIAQNLYRMDLLTNDLVQIRRYIAGQHAPAPSPLPAGLLNAEVAGCAVEEWQNTRVTMICFRTGKPLATGRLSDLWLFVIDRDRVLEPPTIASPQFQQVDKLITASWTQGSRTYVLATEGDDQLLRKFL